MGRQSERLASLDALRGFALLGILVVNIQMFSGWGYLGPGEREALPGAGNDPLTEAIMHLFFEGKFYGLFSLLFGYSFVMLASRMGAGGPAFHRRRMIGLLAFGAAHSVLFWPWDILTLYALVGFLLTPFLNCRPLTLILWGVALLGATIAARWYWLGLDIPGPYETMGAHRLGDNIHHLSGGSFVDVVKANVELSVATALERLESLRGVKVMALFLLGAAAARMQLVESIGTYRWPLLATALAGLAIGFPLALVEHGMIANLAPEHPGQIAAEIASPPLMAIGYAGLLLLFWGYSGNILARATRAFMAPAGRMALTNYVGQSVICVPLFYGFGLNLFAEISLTTAVTIAGGVFLAQLLFSALWLAVFRQGPLEWLWRWQTQGERPKLLGLGQN
ncbi:DUF418 domain-containing protein [Aquisalimonas asiatica]|uniref:DUF418 domain-containing protein n=1 Tax=Aquisalimonas asiatica TaxID=406100 RepID=A0A1H8PZB0_9GAMM|nr:DUF418 domain-containing protein [Aquisalimonas asiatica]SEO47004.1 uncharacterized protein SAMN04488052_101237 [Aquisalimonas asiatica]